MKTVWLLITIVLLYILFRDNTLGREGFHSTPRSSCGMLLPKPRYETSLHPDHVHRANYQRLKDGTHCGLYPLDPYNQEGIFHRESGSLINRVIGHPTSNTKIAQISPQTSCVKINPNIPKYNEYYLKNRVGRTPYAIPAVKIPTDNSIKFVNITPNPTGY